VLIRSWEGEREVASHATIGVIINACISLSVVDGCKLEGLLVVNCGNGAQLHTCNCDKHEREREKESVWVGECDAYMQLYACYCRQ